MNEKGPSGRDRGLVTLLFLSVLLTIFAFVSSMQLLPGTAFTSARAPATVAPSPTPTPTPVPTSATHLPPATAPPPARVPGPPAASGCGSDPMAHVYRPSRLKILNPCVTVSGTIMDIRPQADGDYHVMLKLDPGQKCAGLDCLDDGNRSLQQGDLVTEAVCEHAVSQEDAIATCSQFHNNLAVPPVGSHVTVTGPWVYDTHGWNEIHPIVRFGS